MDIRLFGSQLLAAYASAAGSFASVFLFPTDKNLWVLVMCICGLFGVGIGQILLYSIMIEDEYKKQKLKRRY